MKVRAVRPIKAGEQLTVSYTNHTEPRKVRAQDLFSTKHFKCACERCSEPLESSVDRYLEVDLPGASCILSRDSGAERLRLFRSGWHC